VGVVVPCHRVIGANASLTGYGGGIERKRWLLEHEGAARRVGAPYGKRPLRQYRDFYLKKLDAQEEKPVERIFA
jgi:alkylated DNA nucleotide flippase Atl1